jgi:Beta-galactosidase C-terminal domain
MAQAGVASPVEGLPEPVRASTARGGGSQRLWFLSNWSSSTQTVSALPVSGTELFGGDRIEAGGGMSLDPWDMKIVVES